MRYRFAYKGLEGYTCAPVATFEAMGGVKMVCPNAVWFDDEILLNWPVSIPKDKQPADSQEIKEEYFMVFGLRVVDVGSGRAKIEILMWVDFLRGALGEFAHKAYYEGLSDRLMAYLADHPF
jgi:hypothetical protein